METWVDIPEFPGYSVSDYGWVRNDDTGRTMVLQRNQHGIVNVGLMRKRIQYKRSVSLLVARAFVPRPENEAFDTPILLDGDPYNNHCMNLNWRPHWFAIKYKQQLKDRSGFDDALINIDNGEIFETYWNAAIKYGLLVQDIKLSMLQNTYVFPTFQRFAVVGHGRYPLAR